MADYELDSSTDSDDPQQGDEKSPRKRQAKRDSGAADSAGVDEEKEFFSADEFQDVLCKMAIADDFSSDSDEPEPPKKTEETPQKKSAKHDSGAADLERVTRFTEEKEIFSEDQFRGAMSLIGDRRRIEVAAKVARERELEKVSINKDDVDLIIQELEISRSQAERTLRENSGDIIKALIALTT